MFSQTLRHLSCVTLRRWGERVRGERVGGERVGGERVGEKSLEKGENVGRGGKVGERVDGEGEKWGEEGESRGRGGK